MVRLRGTGALLVCTGSVLAVSSGYGTAMLPREVSNYSSQVKLENATQPADCGQDLLSLLCHNVGCEEHYMLHVDERNCRCVCIPGEGPREVLGNPSNASVNKEPDDGGCVRNCPVLPFGNQPDNEDHTCPPPLCTPARTIVVGSSGVLLESELGSTISEFDVVVRCNCAPIAGFEELVGNKTTHRVTNEIARPRREAGEPKRLRNFVAKAMADGEDDPAWEMGFHTDYTLRKPWAEANNELTAFVTREFHQRIVDRFNITHPTTGFTAMALFSRLFSRPITIAGFSMYSDTDAPTYYWSTPEQDLCGNVIVDDKSTSNAHAFHDADREAEVVAGLVASGAIQVLGQQPPSSEAVASQTETEGLMLGQNPNGGSVVTGNAQGAPQNANLTLGSAAGKQQRSQRAATGSLPSWRGADG